MDGKNYTLRTLTGGARRSTPASNKWVAKEWRLCWSRHRRHTFASRLVMAGVDLATVKELMGHKTIAITMRYAHLSSEHRRSAIAVFDE